MIKISLSYYHPYLHVPLAIDTFESYASLNFEHRSFGENIMIVSNRIHVYLLDPKKGSLTFYLVYDSFDDYYYLEISSPEIDSLIIYALNEAIKKHLGSIHSKRITYK